MPLSDVQDTPTTEADTTYRLKVAAYDLIAKGKGRATRQAQADWHGISRSSLYRLLDGSNPSVKTALRMARDLGVSLETIWEVAS